MPASRTLTLDTLRRAGACHDQLDLFRQTFGRSVDVTPALAVQHVDAFHWDWAARNLLSPQAQAAYFAAVATAQTAHKTAHDAAAATAEAAYKAAWTVYRADATTLEAAYWAAIAPAQKAYWAVDAAIQDAYDVAVARAWAEAYIADATDVDRADTGR